jgi:hypothetical protein
MIVLVCLVVPAQPATLEIKVLANESAGAASPLLRGAGIEDVNHELYGGIYSQMIFGESFEEPAGPDGVSGSRENTAHGGGITWSAARTQPDSQPMFAVSADARSGNQSQVIGLRSGTRAAIINFGLDTQGLFFEPGREYEGHVFVKLNGTAPANMTIEFAREASNGLSGASEPFRFTVALGTAWQRVDFRLVTSHGSTCAQVTGKARTQCVANPEHVCIECDGVRHSSCATAYEPHTTITTTDMRTHTHPPTHPHTHTAHLSTSPVPSHP